MMLFLPLGVDGATLDRKPWVSLTIAAVCTVAFLVTWVIPGNPDGVSEDEVRGLIREALAHPNLTFPPDCASLLSEEGRGMFKRVQSELEMPEEPVDVAALQEGVDAHCQRILASQQSSPLQRYGFIPARGAKQWGWFTYMFLHLGWMHLLGNMLFFYIVGLLLEDAWGRPLFAAFYIAGGLVAAMAHFAIEPGSEVLMVGASGAVAACMGAFCLRFAQRRVRVGYFIWILRIWRGTLGVPGWAWAGLWFGNEVLNYVLWGNNTGVAVMAHIGGFVFGFGAASAMRFTRAEERFVAPVLAANEGGWVQDPRMAEAQTALDGGDRKAAREGYLRVLADQPDNADALLAVGKLDLEDGQMLAGSGRVEKALQLLVGRDSPEPVWHAVDQLGALLNVERLRPGVAWKVAQMLEQEGAPSNTLIMTEPLYAAAGKGTGAMAVRALIRATELRLAREDGLEKAEEYLARAKTLATGDAISLAEKVNQLTVDVEYLLDRKRDRGITLDTEMPAPEQPAAEAAPLPPRIIPCRILQLSDKALMVEAQGGQRRTMPVTEVLAVAVGLLPAPGPEGAPQRQTVLTDLVVSWGGPGQGPTVLRIQAAGLGLPQRYPGLAPREAYSRFLADLLQHSAANALPDASTLAEGRYPRFITEEQLTHHYYGPAPARA